MVAARRDRTHTDISPRSGRTENRPGSARAEISSQSGLPGRKGVLGPLPQPSPAPSVSSPAPWNHTHCAPGRRSDLGVSGLGNPGPNPIPSPSLRRGRQGSRGRSSSSPAPDSAPGNPEGKGRGGGARRAEPPSPRGSPSARLVCAPPSPLPTLGGSMGEAAAGRTGPGRERAGLAPPTLGEESWVAAGEGCPGRAGAAGRGGARSPAGPRPGPRDGGCRSARTRLGAGLRALGAGSAAWGSRSPHPTGAAAVSAPPLVSGSRTPPAARARAGGGVGGGPRRARPGARGPGLAPPQSDAPGDPHVALRPLRGRTPRLPAGRAPPLTRGRPATDSRPRGHGQTQQTLAHTAGHIHTDLVTLCHRQPPTRTPTNIGQSAHARPH